MKIPVLLSVRYRDFHVFREVCRMDWAVRETDY